MTGNGQSAPRKTTGKARLDLAERIVEASIAMAEETGWEDLRLRRVAERLGVPLADVLAHFRDLDGVADAWFRRGWAAMLAPPPEGFADLPGPERLHFMMMRWFDAFAAHRRATVAMIDTKIYPSHPHHWVPLVFNLSRTIQWLREAALCDAPGLRRQMEEVGLTALFLATLRVWARDDTPEQERTRRFLRRRLARADRLMVWIWGAKHPPGEAEPA